MIDFIIVVVLLVVIGAALIHIRKAKKSGAKCIGCPAGGNCPHHQNASSECSCGCANLSEQSNNKRIGL